MKAAGVGGLLLLAVGAAAGLTPRAQGGPPFGVRRPAAVFFQGRRLGAVGFAQPGLGLGTPYGLCAGRFGGPFGRFGGLPLFGSSVVIASPQIVVPQPVVIPQPIVVPQPVFLPADDDDFDPDVRAPIWIRPRQPAGGGAAAAPPQPAEVPRPEKPEKPLPGAAAGKFRPVVPADRARARRAEEPAPPAEPVPRFEPPAWPVEPPAADAPAAHERLLGLGREAFLAAEFARAARLFRQASDVLPAEPTAYFLLGQAHAATGRYREAVAAIQEGLRRRPDWPAARFRPRELYGDNVAEFGEHLARVQEALKANPDDPVLLFLTGYLLWFDGRQEEARPLFKRAAARAADPRFSELFLKFASPAPARAPGMVL